MRNLILTTLVIAGCTSTIEPSVDGFRAGDDRLVVTTDSRSYRIGEAMEVAIRNVSTGDVGVSLCPGTWEHLDGGDWRRSEQLMICSSEYTPLPAGATLKQTVIVPEGLPAGDHRVVVHLQPTRGDVPSGSVSNTFVVQD